MANTKKIDTALASKMAQVEFDYVEDKASAFLMFNDMLELFRNVHPDGSLEQGQMYLVGDSFVATTSVKVGETYLAKDIVGVASPDEMKAKVETTPMLALRRSRAAALIAAGFGLPFEIREAKKAEYEKEHGLKVKEAKPEVQEETDNVEKSNVVESPKAAEETKEVPVEEQPEEKPKKRRGRPRKQQVPVEQEQPEEVVEAAVEAEEQPIEVEAVEAETEVRVKEKTDEVALDASSEEVSLFDVKEDKEESTEEQAAVTEVNEVQEDVEAEDVQSEENSVADESSDLLTNMDAGQAETVQIDFIEERNEDVPVSEVKSILPEQPESLELLPEKSPKEIMAEVGKALPEYVDVSISYELAKAKVSAVVRRPSTDVTYGQMLATLKAVKDGSESEFANSFTCIIRWLLNQAYLGQSPYKERKADIDAALQLYVNNIELFDELFVKYKAEA